MQIAFRHKVDCGGLRRTLCPRSHIGRRSLSNGFIGHHLLWKTDLVEQVHYLRLRVARRALLMALPTEMPPAALVRVADFMRSSVMLALSPWALLGESGGEHPQVKHTSARLKRSGSNLGNLSHDDTL